VPAGLCTCLNLEDSVEAPQTQTDKTAGRQADFIDKFVKGFRYVQMLFVGAYSVSTFMRLGTMVFGVLAVADSTERWYRLKDVTNSNTSLQIKERVERSFRENLWYTKMMDFLKISMLTQGKFGTTKISITRTSL
jgi:hypothetical protein